MKRSKIDSCYCFPLSLQEEFAPYASLRGASRSTGVVARVVVEPSRDIESLRGRMGESARQLNGLFESVLSESFGG